MEIVSDICSWEELQEIFKDKKVSKFKLPHSGGNEKIQCNSTEITAIHLGHMTFTAFQSPALTAQFQENVHPVERN